jgi:hypothetical protein
MQRQSPAAEIGASCVAATFFPLALNWTDVIKTRMQTPPAAGSTARAYAGGFGDSARRITAEEGLLRLFSTGLPAALLREVLVVGTRVGAYPAVRDAISRFASGGSDTAQSGARGEASVCSKLGAGLVLGAVSGLLVGLALDVKVILIPQCVLFFISGSL